MLGIGRTREEQEVRNGERLMKSVAARLIEHPNMPVTEDLISLFHYLTTDGIDYPDNVPGQYRNHPVHAGTYLPAESGDDVRRLMAEFIG